MMAVVYHRPSVQSPNQDVYKTILLFCSSGCISYSASADHIAPALPEDIGDSTMKENTVSIGKAIKNLNKCT
jgi:hypothetical protein